MIFDCLGVILALFSLFWTHLQGTEPSFPHLKCLGMTGLAVTYSARQLETIKCQYWREYARGTCLSVNTGGSMPVARAKLALNLFEPAQLDNA